MMELILLRRTAFFYYYHINYKQSSRHHIFSRGHGWDTTKQNLVEEGMHS